MAASIPNDLGTAVNIQMMVFGNMDPNSGTGVAMSRNSSTGARELEAAAAKKLHAAALKTTGADIDADRVVFVEMSAAVQTLVEHIRPVSLRWPKLYIYHCPMSNGNWIQATDNMANPYYGFKMLKCGELQSVK